MPSWKRVIVSGSNATLNSLTVTNGITGSLFGTASNITPAITNDGGNRILTSNGDGTINGESYLTFDGNTLELKGTLNQGDITFNIAPGGQSHAEGSRTTASGSHSHAEGSGSIAKGNASHAEGYQTSASADYSHAEGFNTIASGSYSHAEGYNTLASGSYSHAEGDTTRAEGLGSHTEGVLTRASGQASHAEGIYTTASGAYSHAEGESTVSLGIGSHAEGRNTTATGGHSHAEGSSTIATGNFSHAEGYNTIASGSYSHAEGQETIASGPYSHAEGKGTTAIGNWSHAEGTSTIAFGDYSHAEGYLTISSGSNSHAEGQDTQAIGDYSHAEGYNTIASGSYSHAEGQYTTASGAYSHAEGSNTVSSGISSHAAGYYTLASGNYQSVIGMYNQSSTNQGAFIIGNGTGTGARSNLLYASGSQVQITGSLVVSAGITGALTGNASTATTANATTAAITFNNGGSGATSGTTFNGSTARTISYNTIGAQPLLTNPVTGTGTDNRVAVWSGTTTQDSSDNLTFDGSTLNIIGGKATISTDGTYGAGYGSIGFGGLTNGYNRIFGSTGTSDGLFICSATGRGINFRANGGATTHMAITSAGYVGIGTTTANVGFVNLSAAYTAGPTLGSGIVGSQALLANNGLYGMYSGVSSNGDVWHQVQRNDASTATYNILLNPAGGNVGIGTSAPSANLQIGTNSSGNSSGDNSALVRIGSSSLAGRVHGLTIANTATATIANEAALSFIVAGNYSATGIITTVLQNTSLAYSDMTFSLFNGSINQERVRIKGETGNVGIGTSTPGAYKLNVNGDTNVIGTLTATVKSFIIDHPTKEGKKLQYGVLEGPEHSVYVRGKLTNNNTITLPDHWTGLVHEDTITVNLTPIGNRQDLWVETVTDTTITVGSDNEINCFYTVFAERKDIEKLVTEFDK